MCLGSNYLNAVIAGSIDFKPHPRKRIIDSFWDNADGCYVTRYREPLERVASTLGEHVRAVFNPERKYAEILKLGSGVLFTVTVTANRGVPEEAIVVASSPTTHCIRALFRKNLALLRVRFVRKN